MNYFSAIAQRKRAFAQYRMAREHMRAAVADAEQVYRAYPAPVLVGSLAVGAGLAQFRFSQTLLISATRLIGGPVSGLLKRVVSAL